MSEARRGTGQDWARFFEAHHKSLGIYAMSLVGNLFEAQDLLQDVLVRMVRQRRPLENARAYVMQSLRHAAIDHGRGQTARTVRLQEDGIDVAFINTETCSTESLEMALRTQAALRRLSNSQREVIVLKVYAEMTFNEIAAVLDIPQGTVVSHHARGLSRLRRYYEEAMDHVA